jgi:hypothetical protein
VPLHLALQLLGMCIGGELRLVRGDGHLSGHQGFLLPVAADHTRNPDWVLPPTALLTILYDVMVLLHSLAREKNVFVCGSRTIDGSLATQWEAESTEQEEGGRGYNLHLTIDTATPTHSPH